ncbi:MAG: hypothetical protein H6705_19730 [Myxococcales bacterium]|nr:hypothetical protein [Myxococcales bacterium]
MPRSTPFLTLLQLAIAIAAAIGLRAATDWPALGCLALGVVASYPAAWLVALIVGALR